MLLRYAFLSLDLLVCAHLFDFVCSDCLLKLLFCGLLLDSIHNCLCLEILDTVVVLLLRIVG